jgi:uncharacterized protein (TIGR02246 family)
MIKRFPSLRYLAVACLLVCSVALVLLAGDSKSDEAAILAKVNSYVAAYNRGDAQAVAAHWSDTGEWVSPSGEKFTGKEEIAGALKSLFAENKGVTIEVENPAVRIVSADVAVEEGTVVVHTPGAGPETSTYIAIHVKKNGEWKLDSVRETAIVEPPAAVEPLEALGWLVGEWVDADSEEGSAARVAWTKNKSFLNYAFQVSFPEADDLEGTQIIGWDPANETIRSWMFDSDGGFGGGTWTQKDNTWVVKFSQVLPDGREASATNVYTVVDANTFTWKSIGRKLDGEFLPNIEETIFVRKGSVQAADKDDVDQPGKNSTPEKVLKPVEKSPPSSKTEKVPGKSEKPAPTKEKTPTTTKVPEKTKGPDKSTSK